MVEAAVPELNTFLDLCVLLFNGDYSATLYRSFSCSRARFQPVYSQMVSLYSQRRAVPLDFDTSIHLVQFAHHTLIDVCLHARLYHDIITSVQRVKLAPVDASDL